MITPLRIPDEDKARLRVMFIAKHAGGAGIAHQVDGNHAIYHYEICTVLDRLGFKELQVATRFHDLFEKPDVDFIFSLLNRGGFLNSEMMAPLLATRHGIPFLGATPILRGLADDKHLMKLCARARGVPTARWSIYRRGAPIEPMPWTADRYVAKPNASSASWGVADARSWEEVSAEIDRIHAEGHDALVEPFLNGIDVEIPVIGAEGAEILPIMTFEHDPTVLRTYGEKRGFEESAASLVPLENGGLGDRLRGYTRDLIPELWPFDYGRFEFRVNRDTGEVNFLEVNLQANIWSKRVIGQSAALAGLTHPELIETILCHSMRRQGVIKEFAHG